MDQLMDLVAASSLGDLLVGWYFSLKSAGKGLLILGCVSAVCAFKFFPA